MRLKALPLVVLLATAVACSTLTTTMDYDKSANFSSFKTYTIKDDGSVSNPLLAKRLDAALTAELGRKGLTRNDSNPDLVVMAHTRLSKETQINTYNSGWGYGWGWYGGGGGMTTSTVQEIPVGTLIVDLVDVKRKELAWRGTASDTLNPSASPEDKEKNLNAAVAKMFEAYPPGAKK